ncbi:aldehyde dehydrogenase [Neisseria sp. Ec49-e6-T10]|uniref:aldehyde dehydrogenase n=1 Tax=Neisseria sp. Ec49-e6-T10 TaxID=3140744 RepID=UPI003EB71A79
MNLDSQQLQQLITNIVLNQVQDVGSAPVVAATNIDATLKSAKKAQNQLVGLPLKKREQLICTIRTHIGAHQEQWAKTIVQNTQMGNCEDKVTSFHLISYYTPGLDCLEATVDTGDDGLTLHEYSPYGVVLVSLPYYYAVEALLSNIISALSAGNAIIFGVAEPLYQICQQIALSINQAIVAQGGPDFLIHIFTENHLQALTVHDDIDLLLLTGQEALSSVPFDKKLIVTGSAHTPVLVDETAQIAQAAEHIVSGASFDHNLSCLSEKVIIAVDAIADFLLHHLVMNGAYLVSQTDMLRRLEYLLMSENQLKGRSATDILNLLGVYDQQDVKLLIIETDEHHSFVWQDLMLPVLPFVRVKDVDNAINIAAQISGKNRHTAVMHSKHIDHLTRCAKTLQTVMFIKNAPSYAGLGLKGEGFTSFTIAGKTGEGAICARHFSRARRCVLSEGFLIK